MCPEPQEMHSSAKEEYVTAVPTFQEALPQWACQRSRSDSSSPALQLEMGTGNSQILWMVLIHAQAEEPKISPRVLKYA